MPCMASPWQIAWLVVVLPRPPLSPAMTIMDAMSDTPFADEAPQRGVVGQGATDQSPHDVLDGGHGAAGGVHLGGDPTQGGVVVERQTNVHRDRLGAALGRPTALGSRLRTGSRLGRSRR